MNAPENPSAFPFPEVRAPDGTGISEGSAGMTLRDWFAGQALGRLAGNDDTVARASWTAEPEQFLADWAYRIADAMLSARGAA